MEYPEIEWQEQFNIGEPLVDKAHRQLFSIVHKLIELTSGRETQKSRFACIEGIKFLKAYTLQHFGEEEGFMRSIGYERMGLHARIHERFRSVTLPALEDELTSTDFSVEAIQHFLGMCVGWLTGHIMVEDRAITGCISALSAGQSLRTTQRLEEAVIGTLGAVFGLQSRLINEHFTGEGMVEPVICELSYASETKRLNVLMPVESRLILATTGKMLGMRFSRVDSMVLSAVRELAQMIAARISSCFFATGSYALQSEKILTGDDLRSLFNERHPQYSLLFDTGAGYMAFCATSE